MNEQRGFPKVLVFGATGHHGGTGTHIVRRLLDEGRAVRVLARAASSRTAELAQHGAEVTFGDLTDWRTLVAALDGIDLAYFTYPVAPGIVDAAANYAAAVRDAGAAIRTVVMSMGPSHPDSPSALGRAQNLAEQILQWAELDVLILRVAALFHENLEILHAESIAEERIIRNSFGDQQVAWISALDAAEVAVAALVHPSRFNGPVVYVPGSEQFSHRQIAEKFSALLNTPIRFDPIDQDKWRSELEAIGYTDAGSVVNSAMAQHISALGAVVARGGPTMPADSPALQAYIQKTPVALDEFLTSKQAAFTSGS